MSAPGLPPYGQPASSYPGVMAGSPTEPATSGRTLAWTSIALAALVTIAQPVIQMVLLGMMSGQGSSLTTAQYGLATAIAGGVYCVIAVVGLVLGLVAARGSARLLSGIGIGANGLVLAGFAAGLLVQPLYAVL
ncbi:hypothetical protein [Microbacterium sediminis]|uniref:Uncharacterized protein n=1 Tax=Microbacterium sediminis TaxID=904291 RepID=A0A1B9N9Q8_9MICO|nr:hypothetical protein [Microbacterium sediminis]OCG73342.1 hypothetical protein A7J15_08645 [Microbacterium sediminis]QBR75244.1 hypothetical protein E3O41_13115 [Microbacterium sediminis]